MNARSSRFKYFKTSLQIRLVSFQPSIFNKNEWSRLLRLSVQKQFSCVSKTFRVGLKNVRHGRWTNNRILGEKSELYYNNYNVELQETITAHAQIDSVT